jgi:hypothetical protein
MLIALYVNRFYDSPTEGMKSERVCCAVMHVVVFYSLSTALTPPFFLSYSLSSLSLSLSLSPTLSLSLSLL